MARHEETELCETLLRIEGSMTVLQEILQVAALHTAPPASAATPAPESALALSSGEVGCAAAYRT